MYSDDDLRDYTWDEIDADARIDRLIKRGGLVNISPGEYVLTDDLITEEAANSYYKDSYDAMLDAAQTLPEGLSLSTVIKRADPMKYKEIQSEFIDDDEDESLSYEELDEMTDDYINATMNFEDTGMSGSRAIQVTDKSVYERGLEAFKTDKIESGYPFKCISTSDGDKFIDVDDVYDDVALEEKVMNMDEFE